MIELPLKFKLYPQYKYHTHSSSLYRESLIADASGALYWPSENLLVISDMHLEKGSSSAAKGMFLPPYDTRDTLLRLANVIKSYKAKTIVSLGDSFHDKLAFNRIRREDLEFLHLIQDGRRWIWINGNHDPEIPSKVGGECFDELQINGLILRHKPSSKKSIYEIAGHMHPSAKISLYGKNIRRPCFIFNRKRLIMPAFGSYTGGLNILDSAFVPLFRDDKFCVWMQGDKDIYPIDINKLQKDRTPV
ncbi:MAG: hypothetical protein TECD_00300 [Hyphomicrobiaceae bacterium hypho_1]